MSDQSSTSEKRGYRKRRRAELEEQTRLRITEATMDLHGSVGPAKTTISAIADRAGVQRATVYRHFPDEATLIAACGAHWMSLNPPPDPVEWSAIADPEQRLRSALEDLYGWFERTEPMLEKLVRDRETVPALAAEMQAMDGYFAAVAATIIRGRPERGGRRRRAAAALAHALTFETWRSLYRGQHLERAEAVEMMARLVGCAAR